MLQTAQLLPLKGLLTLGFDPIRFQIEPPACYRASWQLPGPDSHRLATTSLSLSDQLSGITSNCLDARIIEASAAPNELRAQRRTVGSSNDVLSIIVSASSVGLTSSR